MLKLNRRRVDEFLSEEQRQALEARVASASKLAATIFDTNPDEDAKVKSKRIGNQWDAFVAGRTSRGTFDALWLELQSMAFQKCAFCEVPAPDTVEHLIEKSEMPSKAFDWDNLLAACSKCNIHRQHSGITSAPIDPTQGEPLDFFGWDKYGNFAPKAGHEKQVANHNAMYGLDRYRAERMKHVTVVRSLLSSVIFEEPIRNDTIDALQRMLVESAATLGPIREYLLRPPTDDDALIIEEALRRLPRIRTWIAPWLRPPSWATRWL